MNSICWRSVPLQKPHRQAGFTHFSWCWAEARFGRENCLRSRHNGISEKHSLQLPNYGIRRTRLGVIFFLCDVAYA